MVSVSMMVSVDGRIRFGQAVSCHHGRRVLLYRCAPETMNESNSLRSQNGERGMSDNIIDESALHVANEEKDDDGSQASMDPDDEPQGQTKDFSGLYNVDGEEEEQAQLSEIEEEDDDNDSMEEGTDSEPFVEPSYENFGSVPFAIICRALENICRARAAKKNKTLNDYLCKLLPPKMMEKLSQPKPATTALPEQPQSIYPLMRIICPDVDNRRLQVKHRMLAIAYIEAFGWNRDTKREAKMLLGYNDPHLLASNANAAKCAGDLSGVLFHVLDGRVLNKPSSLTVGHVNEILDDLAAIATSKSKGRGAYKTNHDWKDEQSQQTTESPRKKRKKEPTLFQLRASWMKRMLPGGDRSISSLEHKWLARIILSEMKFGIGFEKLLAWYHPDGPALFSGHNSLRAICNKLCQPAMRRLVAERRQANTDDKTEITALKTPPSLRKRVALAQVQLGNQFTPMFSSRTGFDRLLTDISKRHRDYVKNPDDGHYERPALHSLAITHPAFSVETKLDGERMLIHYFHETGIVKIHSRSSKWYSNLYSPVLGPAVRQAFAELGCDLILDGEVLAWDEGSQENIPFGNNRTVAKLHHDWMLSEGLLDRRDCNLHANEDDGVVVRSAYNWDASDRVADLAGKECWITFVAFDVVYIGGCSARELIDSTISPYLVGEVKPGSLVELEAMERKKLLYRILETDIPNKLEKVVTKIVRPTGEIVDADEYFSFRSPLQEHGYPYHLLDSITAAFRSHVPNLSEIDKLRRGNLSDEEISLKRASAINQQYTIIVEEKLLEGLIFKDLSTCYVLDKESRSYSFWLKFKPDYFNGSVASDLDLVIVGAYYATGLRHSGQPSSFLCACVDSHDDDLFWPVVKVNAGSVNFTELNKIFEHTGYQKAWDNKQTELGSWVRDDGDHMPDFIAQKSDGPWKPSKKDRPSLWIDPRHVCVVLQLNAGEITESPSFDLGLTLRFPRITRVRYDKRHSDVENTSTLSDIFMKVEANRAKSANSFAQTSPGVGATTRYARFKTEKQFEQGKKNRKGATRVKVKAKIAPKPEKVESRCLEDLSFCVLDGDSFSLQGMDAEEAESEGWLEYATEIKSKYDVQAFIKLHGGKVVLTPDYECCVLGSDAKDIRVKGFIDSIEHARMQPKPKGKNPTQKSIKYAKQAQLEGVLRWTFPFRLFARWKSLPEDQRRHTIQASFPEELRPNILDYLARPTSPNSVFRDLGNIDSIFMMRRALELENSESPPFNSNWYDEVNVEDRWLFANDGHQEAWFPNMRSKLQKISPIFFLFYPDVKTGFADCVASVLPLLKIHRLTVADSLGGTVSHIVCEMKTDLIQYKRGIRVDPDHAFVNPKHGKALLEMLETNNCYPEELDNSLYIVSPLWIRKRCNERLGGLDL